MDKSEKKGKGIPLTPEQKIYIFSLKSYFDRNRKEFCSKDPADQQTADALEIGLSTVRRVLAEYRKNPDNINTIQAYKGRPSHSLDASLQEIVRQYIREANLHSKYITLETIRSYILEKFPEDFHISTLARALDRWGFEFEKGKRTQHLKEKDYVVAARQKYLRRMRNNRCSKKKDEIIRPEVYLDESYVNKNHSNDYVWYSSDDGPWIQKPTGKGERLIIMHAITKNGWVPNVKTVFKSNRKTGDYHGQMNWDIFKKWFTDRLIPNIPKNSIIIMDNAPYHNVLSNSSAPIPSSSKKTIRAWLEKNNVAFSHDCLKVEMMEILKKLAPSPTYAIDEIAKEHGHEAIRTPQYHPELQPIEICWGVVKNEVARNCDFTMSNLLSQLERAFTKVTATTCIEIIKKIKKLEDKFWSEDAKMEEIEDIEDKI